jgi:endonuclease I
MRKYYTLLVCFICLSASASVPLYYTGVESLQGYSLKSALAKVLARDHVEQSYTSLIDIYFISDLDTTYENDGSILDIYSEIPNASDPYVYRSRSQKCGGYRQESDCFNREHLFPQSVFHKQYPMKSDFHHVFPTDGSVNGKRWHYAFGEVGKPTWQSMNGSKLGINVTRGFSDTVFEPIDEFKGDIARAMLYFATRYEDQIAAWDHEMLNGSSDQVYADWFLNIMLKWHKQDPVSKHEIHRNNVGQSYQGNRNPFIDHPEWVEKIWTIK